MKVYISTSSFGSVNTMPLTLLKDAGHQVTLNPHGRKLTADEIYDYANDHDALIAGTEDLGKLVNNTNSIKIISRVGIGLNSVPLNDCKNKNIKVTYTPDSVTKAVAELTLSFMLNLQRNVSVADHDIHNGSWRKIMGYSLSESTIGILGFGRIANELIKLLMPFNVKSILINDIVEQKEKVVMFRESGLNMEQVDINRLLEESNIITIHLPGGSDTVDLISDSKLSLMKKDAVLINTSRGDIINEESLYYALKNNQIRAAALDVFKDEPYAGKLSELDNIILTPHIGSYTSKCRGSMELEAAEDVISFFKNEPLKNEVPDSEYEIQSNK